MAWPTLPGQPAVGSAAQASWADAVIQALSVLGSPSTPYTPAWTAATTNPAIGNGSIVGSYFLAGKWCWGSVHILTGSTTTYGSGAYSISLPTGVVPAARYQVYDAFGVGCAVIGASRFTIEGIAPGAAATSMLLLSASALVTNTAPGTFASGSHISTSFMYETT